MSDILDFGQGRSKNNNSAFGAPQRWVRTKDGVGIKATYNGGVPKNPEFFFSVIWQINMQKPSQAKNPESPRTVRLELEAPRYDNNRSLNDLKREVGKALLDSDFCGAAEAADYECIPGRRRSDDYMRENLTTTLFRVIIAEHQIKPAAEHNIQAVHDTLHPYVDQVLLSIRGKTEKPL
jgi:hypothetical protein